MTVVITPVRSWLVPRVVTIREQRLIEQMWYNIATGVGTRGPGGGGGAAAAPPPPPQVFLG